MRTQGVLSFARLVAVYLALGFPGKLITDTVNMLSPRYGHIISQPFRAQLVRCIEKHDVWTIIQLGE